MTLPSSYADVPDRKWALETPEAEFLFRSMPAEVRRTIEECFLSLSERGLEMVLRYLVAHSEIARLIAADPSSALAFEYLYERSCPRPLDEYWLKCKAGYQIYRRLCALEENLPKWIGRNIDKQQPYCVDNIGSGTGRDMIGVLRKHPHLTRRLSVRNIDRDTEALQITRELAKEHGFREGVFCFEDKPFSCVTPRNAQLLLLIGVLCPLDRRLCETILRKLLAYACPGGLIIFSTAQYRMLVDDPLTDFLMRLPGWGMNYRSDQDARDIARASGWQPLGQFFDESRHHHCMTVARAPE